MMPILMQTRADTMMSTTCDSLAGAEEPSPTVPAPPDGGYGWVCVAACFTINCFTWGVVAVRLFGSAQLYTPLAGITDRSV